MKNLVEIQEFLKDKEICVLGNATSILNNKKDIDSHEVVCRMNRGVPQGREEFIGSRTDIVFMSTRFRPEWEQQFNAKYIIWCTECQNLASDWIKENAVKNPPEDWRALKTIYGDKLPSTGCIAINFLIKHIEFKKLIIYGFAFMKGGTWYNKMVDQPWHDSNKEEQVIMNLIKNKNVEMINE